MISQSPSVSRRSYRTTTSLRPSSTRPGGVSAHRTGELIPCLIYMGPFTTSGRVGEAALLEPEEPLHILGRDPLAPASGAPHPPGTFRPVLFMRQRPPNIIGPHSEPRLLVLDPSVSRQQLLLTPARPAGGLMVECIGKASVFVNGKPLRSAVRLSDGDLLRIGDQALFLFTHRPRELRPLQHYPVERLNSFGRADRDGIVGESPASWTLRDNIAHAAKTEYPKHEVGKHRGQRHVLVVGQSGTGKLLVAQAIHRLSAQYAHQPWVYYNLASVPSGVLAGVLFGNRRNFPQAGMDDSRGLFGEAEDRVLCLDELHAASSDAQDALLTALDPAGGQYFRLGEDGRVLKLVTCRVIACSNAPSRIAPDLRNRRFPERIEIPGFPERREDIPLLLAHLLRQREHLSGCDVRRFFRGDQPAVSLRLLEYLLTAQYPTNMGDLELILNDAIRASRDGELSLDLPALHHRSNPTALEVSRPDPGPAALPRRAEPPARATPPTAEEVQRAIEAAHGNVSAAARRLEVNRDQMNRLINKHHIIVQRPPRRGGSGVSPASVSEPG